MSHDYHDALPGYSSAQILHDGCGECELRGRNINLAINSMDRGRFALAWKRAADWNMLFVPDVSSAERPLLEALWAVQLQMQRVCGLPIGELPRRPVVESLDSL